ncbi:putative beta-glycosyltransferase protein [Candidatus Vecturithrix granuli]|uniref:Putative beta-glycosyltransferase protein n=1 Tax=Vecturithrix granuli TaxID=1499967 RepID=A0A081BTV7_VECG1|nr:putative beta-glycosyltransferase protein [Candidatus Vecturithrix granuli]
MKKSFTAVCRSPWFVLNWCYLRPFLKRITSAKIHVAVCRIRNRFQPSFCQYAPRPLQLPASYSTPIALPAPDRLPVVSIVTPSLNQAAFLERTMQSVLRQNYPKLEYIIMDGASKDGTDRILTSYADQVAYLDSRKDGGQAHALNHGFRYASGEIMAWLNADDLLLPGAIACIVQFFLDHPEVDVVYGHRICIDEEDREIGRWILPSHDPTILSWANYVPQETLFWRRRLWEQVGASVDESYQFALDWELLLRFQKSGANFARIPRFLGAFRVHPAQKTSRLADIGQQEAARLHASAHSRPVEWLEVRYHVRKYLMRTVWQYLLLYMKCCRSGNLSAWK